MLNIIAACGNGMGSSLMVKMKIEEVFRELNVPAKVEHMSVGDARSQGNSADLIFVSNALENNLSGLKNVEVIGLRNLLSKEEILEKVQERGFDKV